MASFPASIYSTSNVTDGVDYPQATHINTLQNEIAAIETALKINFGGTPTTGDVLYYDGTSWTKSSAFVSATSTTTLTNKRITKRVVTVTESATPAINVDNGDIFIITALAQAITSLTTNLTGTPTDGQMFELRITDNATARAITPGASFLGTANNTLTGLTTTISKCEKLLWEYSTALSAWELVGRDHSA